MRFLVAGLCAALVLWAHGASARGTCLGRNCIQVDMTDVEEVNAEGRPRGRAADCVKPFHEVDTDLYPQGMRNWCWLASAQMIMSSLGVTDFEQCAQVNRERNRGRQRNGRPQCCVASTGNFMEMNRCNSTGWPDRSFRDHGYTFDSTADRDPDNTAVHRPGRVLNWESIQEQLSSGGGRCKEQPFAFSWYYGGGAGHMMVASGYMTTDSGTQKIRIHDPVHSGGKKFWIDYEYFKQSTGREDRTRRRRSRRSRRRRSRRSRRASRQRSYHHIHWDDYYNFRKIDGGRDD